MHCRSKCDQISIVVILWHFFLTGVECGASIPTPIAAQILTQTYHPHVEGQLHSTCFVRGPGGCCSPTHCVCPGVLNYDVSIHQYSRTEALKDQVLYFISQSYLKPSQPAKKVESKDVKATKKDPSTLLKSESREKICVYKADDLYFD